jgi:thiopurine S-methyltransferase
LPDFWDKRFAEGAMPWDAGSLERLPAVFRAFFADYPARRGLRVLIPGCGTAYEAAHLDRAGHQVTALDFSREAVLQAEGQLAGWGGTLLCADFFAHAPEAAYDLVFERAFLCALPRKLWPDYAAAMARLVAPGGVLAGFFIVGEEAGGPPFACDPTRLEALLAPHFVREVDEAVNDSLPVFAGRERWQVWRRR